jgi:hypothetical protein
MRPNPKLEVILASPEQMAASRSIRSALFEPIGDRNGLKEIASLLDKIEAPSTSAIFEALAPFIANVQWVNDFLVDLVTSCAEQPLFCPPLKGGHDPLSNDGGVSNLVLLNHRLAIISLHGWSNRSGASTLPPIAQMGGMPSLIRGLGGATAQFYRWSCDGFDECRDVASLIARPDLDLHIGSEPMIIDGRCCAIAFKSAEGPFAALQVRDKRNANSRVLEFDTANGALRNVMPAHVAEARIPLMFALLRQTGALTEALLEPYLEHPSYDIRWQAMRELLALTGVASASRLEAFLAREPNPTVQRAGRRAVELLASVAA